MSPTALYHRLPSNGPCSSAAARHCGLADVGAFQSNSCSSASTRKIGFKDASQLRSWVRASSKKKEQSNAKRKRVLEQVKTTRPEGLEGSQQVDLTTSRDKTDDSQRQGTEKFEEAVKTTSLPMAGRGRILKACFLTSAGLGAAGLLLRQVTHWAADSGFPVPDCTVVMPFSVDQSQVGVVAVMVVVVSSLRLLLLQLWPEFRQSSTVSNQQILGPLEPFDYVVVSALPGISEELLFRGVLLPLVGVDWKGALVAGLIFGALHRSGGRNAAFAVWASTVGIMYGLTSVFSHSLTPPIAIHSLANIASVGIWRLNKND